MKCQEGGLEIPQTFAPLLTTQRRFLEAKVDSNNSNWVQLKALNFQFSPLQHFLLFTFYTIINFSLSLSQRTQTFSPIVPTINMYFNAIWFVVSIKKFRVICMKNDSTLNFVEVMGDTLKHRSSVIFFRVLFDVRTRDVVNWKKCLQHELRSSSVFGDKD